MALINLAGSVSTTGSSILGAKVISFATDANHTLSVAEYTNKFLQLTSGVALTAQRSLFAPMVQGQEFTIQNLTTGDQEIQVIGVTDTGGSVTIPYGSTVSVVCDGNNYLVTSGGVSGTGLPNLPGADGYYDLQVSSGDGYWVPVTSGTSSGTYAVTFQPGGTAASGIYVDEASLNAALSVLDNFCYVYIDLTYVSNNYEITQNWVLSSGGVALIGLPLPGSPDESNWPNLTIGSYQLYPYVFEIRDILLQIAGGTGFLPAVGSPSNQIVHITGATRIESLDGSPLISQLTSSVISIYLEDLAQVGDSVHNYPIFTLPNATSSIELFVTTGNSHYIPSIQAGAINVTGGSSVANVYILYPYQIDSSYFPSTAQIVIYEQTDIIGAGSVGYSPATPGDWATPPTEVAQALDDLAARSGSATLPFDTTFQPGGTAGTDVYVTEAALTSALSSMASEHRVYIDLSQSGGSYTFTQNWNLGSSAILDGIWFDGLTSNLSTNGHQISNPPIEVKDLVLYTGSGITTPLFPTLVSLQAFFRFSGYSYAYGSAPLFELTSTSYLTFSIDDYAKIGDGTNAVITVDSTSSVDININSVGWQYENGAYALSANAISITAGGTVSVYCQDANQIDPSYFTLPGCTVYVTTGTIVIGNSTNTVGAAAAVAASGAVVIGSSNGVVMPGDISIGANNYSSGSSIGGAVSEGSDNDASGDGAVAVGYDNYATGVGAVGVGYENTANGQSAVAVGNNNAANTPSSFVSGYYGSSSLYGERIHSLINTGPATPNGIFATANYVMMQGYITGNVTGGTAVLTLCDGTSPLSLPAPANTTIYTLEVKITVAGDGTGYSRSFYQMANITNDSGTITINDTTTLQSFGTSNSSSWTMALTASGGDVIITVGNGSTNNNLTIYAKVSYEPTPLLY